jgi:tetratricopeptide (TPR) repeat protein
LQASRGNPLFLIEMIRELTGSAELPEALPVPPSLQALIQRRLRRFPANGRQVIEALAVLDQPSHFDSIRQVSGRGEEETAYALESGVRWHLIGPHPTETGLYDFSHDLVREAVLQQLTNVRRHLLHRRAANALIGIGGDASAITYHFAQAGDKENEARYAHLAGQEAAAVYAHYDAITYLNRAERLTTDGRERLTIQIQLARIYHFIGRWPESEALYQQILAVAQFHELAHFEAASEAGIGQLLVAQGKHDEALPWLEKACEQQTALHEQHELVETLHHLGQAVWWQGEYQSARAYFEQQYELAKTLQTPLQAVQALSGLGMAYNSLGNQKQALQIYEKMLALAQTVNDQFSIARASSNIGLIHAQQGDFAVALSHWYESIPIYQMLEEKEQLNRTVGNVGRVFQIYGDFEQALICLGWQLALCVGMGAWQTASIALINISVTLYDQKEYQSAQAAAQRAVGLGRKLNIPAFLCDFLAGLASIELELGDYSSGLQHADEAQQIAAKVQRQDVLFMAEHTLIRLQLAAQLIDKETAVAQFQEMLSRWTEGLQAELHYFIWQMDATQETHRQQAAALYGRLYPQSPAAVYRRRFYELTGDTLAPATLPAPPTDINFPQTDLAALMLAIDRVLE